jgi:hypothetical protein
MTASMLAGSAAAWQGCGTPSAPAVAPNCPPASASGSYVDQDGCWESPGRYRTTWGGHHYYFAAPPSTSRYYSGEHVSAAS